MKHMITYCYVSTCMNYRIKGVAIHGTFFIEMFFFYLRFTLVDKYVL